MGLVTHGHPYLTESLSEAWDSVSEGTKDGLENIKDGVGDTLNRFVIDWK